MRIQIIMLLCFLIIHCSTQLTIISNTSNTVTTNGTATTYNSTYINSLIYPLDITCSAAPVSNLKLCNNTCLTCTADKCAECGSQFTISNQFCQLDNSIHTYQIFSYLNSLTQQAMVSDVVNFMYADTLTPLTIRNIVEVCKNNTYQAFMVGLFKQATSIATNLVWKNPIDQIQIKINFMSIVSDITFYIDINGNNVFKKSYTTFSDLSGTYAVSTQGNFLYLDALTFQNVGAVITEVDTAIQSLISNTVNIKFYITLNNNKQVSYSCWGFNDVVIVTRSCQTCVTQEVTDLLNKIGQFTYIVMIIVAALVILLLLMIKIEDIKRKLDFQNKLGSASGNLPDKAINRVIDSLQRSVRTMQKQFKKADKRLTKLMKKS